MLAAVIARRAASKARAQIEWEADQPTYEGDEGETGLATLAGVSVPEVVVLAHAGHREELPARAVEAPRAGSSDAGGWAGR